MAPDENAADTPERPGEPVESAPVTPTAAPAAPAATRWRDTLWTFRSVIAVSLASLLVGGAGGALIVAASDDGPDQRGRVVWMDGPGHGKGPKFRNGPFERRGDGPQWRYDQGQPPNLTPPTTPTTPPTPTTPSPGSGSTS